VREVAGNRIDELPLIRIDPLGPVAEATPVQVVRGFVDAMRAFPVSTDTAAQFLTDEAASQWRPQRETVVYDELSAIETTGVTVDLRVRRIATLDARGSYTPATDRLLAVDHEFVLRRENGEWRIDNPPDRLYVGADFFSDYYLPLSLYFLDLTGDVLVPDPIYLPRGEQLATSLVRGLLEGPTGALGGQLLTVVPPATEVDGAVPVRPDGVVDVRLSGQVLSLSDEQRAQLSAQLVWTLRQIPGVVGVRVLAEGAPLDVPGVAEVQHLNAWDSDYAPYDPLVGREIFALHGARLVSVLETFVSPVEGMWRDGRRKLADFAVARQASLAAVTKDRSRILVGPVSSPPDEQPTTLYRGGHHLVDPTWDRNDRLWVVDRDQEGSRLLVFDSPDDEGARPRRVPMGPLDGSRVEAFEFSPDGLRFVAIARNVQRRHVGPRRIMLGTVHLARDLSGVERVGEVRELVTSGAVLEAPRDVGWTEGAEVSVLARIGGVSPQPYEVRIDGSQLRGGSPDPLLNEARATSLATSTSPDSLTYIGTEQGGLWLQDADRQWIPIGSDPLRLPDYPG
jgi:hypothetical protein